MKTFTKITTFFVLMAVLFSLAGTAFAQDGGHRGKRGGGGASGEVTAVSSDTITVLNRNDESVTVSVSDNTEVYLVASQSEGSLSDIAVGDSVKIHGERNDEGTVTEASKITVSPDGDSVSGSVTAVSDSTITIEDRDGNSTTVTVTASTSYLLGKDGTGSLSDISEDSHLKVYGTTEADGSITADIVMIKNGRDGARGERGQRDGDTI